MHACSSVHAAGCACAASGVAPVLSSSSMSLELCLQQDFIKWENSELLRCDGRAFLLDYSQARPCWHPASARLTGSAPWQAVQVQLHSSPC